MSLWLVRAGSYGEREQVALEKNVVTIGWNDLPDLSKIKTREKLAELYNKVYPDAKKMEAANHVGQIWRFIHEIQKEDLVALPLKTQSAVAIGEVESDYEHKELTSDVKNIRHVKWLKIIPRSSFDQDILYSFGAFMTVCKIERNDAENRVKTLLQKEKIAVAQPVTAEEVIDVEEYAKDQIIKHIGAKFKGHDLARLVEAILLAQGYVTKRSPPGPDGGVDILAASGSFGFGSPHLCVQVKSTQSQADVTVLRNLQGSMKTFSADQGLLVSWGGFNRIVLEEAKRSFFTVRLWDSGDLLEAILENYDRLPDTLQAELPLKKIWGLVFEERE